MVVVEGKRDTLDAHWQLTIGDSTLSASLQPLTGDAVAVTLNGHRRRLQARRDGHVVVMSEPSGETRLFWQRIDAIDHGHHEAESSLTAPMNGTVVALLVEPGAQVEKACR